MRTMIKRSGSGRRATLGLASNEELVRLPDGRRVAIASHGDPQGESVFPFHGIPTNRVGWESVDAPASERGVQVLCPGNLAIFGVAHSGSNTGRN
jgi:hypothetical protein